MKKSVSSTCIAGRERPGEMLEDIFKRLFDAAELAAMDAQTRRIVDRTMTTKLDMMQHLHNTYIDGHLDGEKKGRAEGAREQAVESAKFFLRLGLAVEDIAKGTGLTVEEINSWI